MPTYSGTLLEMRVQEIEFLDAAFSGVLPEPPPLDLSPEQPAPEGESFEDALDPWLGEVPYEGPDLDDYPDLDPRYCGSVDFGDEDAIYGRAA